MVQIFAKGPRLKTKLKWLCGIVFVLALTVAIWPSAYETKSVDSHNQTATTLGSNSPALNQSGSTSGSNSPLIQAGPNAHVTLNTGPDIETIKQALREIQKEKDPDLMKKFPLGYILFTATKRQQIVPLKSPIDSIIQFDWEKGYSVTFPDDKVKIIMPPFLLNGGGFKDAHFESNSFAMPNQVGANMQFFMTEAFTIYLEVVATDPETVMAVGLRPDLRSKPRPSL